MTEQLEALDRLIEAVEVGNFPTTWEALSAAGVAHYSYGLPMHVHAWEAFHGSLDAAKALHEALLPGCEWGMYSDGTCWVKNKFGVFPSKSSSPARAWLLAILHAYRAQIGGDA